MKLEEFNNDKILKNKEALWIFNIHVDRYFYFHHFHFYTWTLNMNMLCEALSFGSIQPGIVNHFVRNLLHRIAKTKKSNWTITSAQILVFCLFSIEFFVLQDGYSSFIFFFLPLTSLLFVGFKKISIFSFIQI